MDFAPDDAAGAEPAPMVADGDDVMHGGAGGRADGAGAPPLWPDDDADVVMGGNGSFAVVAVGDAANDAPYRQIFTLLSMTVAAVHAMLTMGCTVAAAVVLALGADDDVLGIAISMVNSAILA